MVTITLLQTFTGQCCWESNLILPSGKQLQPFCLSCDIPGFPGLSIILFLTNFSFHLFSYNLLSDHISQWKLKCVKSSNYININRYFNSESVFSCFVHLCFPSTITHNCVGSSNTVPSVNTPPVSVSRCQILLLFSCCFPVHSVYWNDPFHCSPALLDFVFGHHGRFSTFS